MEADQRQHLHRHHRGQWRHAAGQRRPDPRHRSGHGHTAAPSAASAHRRRTHRQRRRHPRPGRIGGHTHHGANSVTLNGIPRHRSRWSHADKLAVGGTLDIDGSPSPSPPRVPVSPSSPMSSRKPTRPIVGNCRRGPILPPGYIVVVNYDDGIDTNNIAVVQGVADTYLGWADDNSLVGANRAPNRRPRQRRLGKRHRVCDRLRPERRHHHRQAECHHQRRQPGLHLKRSDASETFNVFVEHSTNLQAPWASIPVPVGVTTGPPVDVVECGSRPRHRDRHHPDGNRSEEIRPPPRRHSLHAITAPWLEDIPVVRLISGPPSGSR